MMRGLRVPTSLFAVAALMAVILPSVASAQAASAPQATPAQQAHAEDADIVQHLNAAITWYRQLASANDSAGQPSDAFFLDNARSLAKQALQMAFQSAETEAALLLAEKGDAATSGSANVSAQSSGEQHNLAESAATTAATISQIHSQMEILNSQITKASGKRLQELIARRDTLQEQLDFNEALEEALQKLSTFMSSNARKAGGLREEINDLKKSVPEIFATTPGKGAAPASSNSSATSSAGSGLISQVAAVFSRSGDVREIKQLIQGAGKVTELVRKVQSPLRTRLRATVEQGRSMSNQPAAQGPASMEAARQKMTSLTTQFKRISAATIPLAQEIILLDESQASLRQWEDSAHRGYIQTLRSFLIHVAVLLIGIAVVVVISELWRRITFRYVHEARMRHQLLLLRHLTTGLLLAIVLALGFVSEFSSLATFAGFVAAGIAVALQTLLLSVAGYFFLIGRHGVMVGDRISVSGITGDVIYVGLVRIYLTELAGAGTDLQPTGRVVVISNSVLFQGIPLLKQIPGTAYAWHEVVVKLERGSDYTQAESKLLEAVNSVYSQYRESIEEQHQAGKGLMTTITPVVPTPQARVQLSDEGLDLIVRYPVVLRRETEIDNEMAKKVVEVIHSDPELKAAVGSPTIRPAMQG